MLLQGKIGEGCDVNTELTFKIAKGLKVMQSVGLE